MSTAATAAKAEPDAHYHALLAAHYTNKQTLNAYVHRLKMLKEKLGFAAAADTALHAILTDPDTFYPRIRAAYESLTTRKNILTPLLVLYRMDPALAATPAGAAASAKWRKLHDDLAKLQDAKIKRSEPEEKQIEKYTSYEEITSKYEELKKRGYHDTERHSSQYLLLSVLVHLRPKRADLGNITIFREKDPRSTDMNYIVLRKRGGSYLVMNLFKTSKYYQTVEEEIPEGLKRDIETSLARWPRELLFRKTNGEPMSNNTYSVFVKKTFEEFFGRGTGVSLLRHIYITEKLEFDDMTLEEQNAEAKLMLHTTGLQRKYKWPKKVLCPKLCAAYIAPTHKTRKVKRLAAPRNTVALAEEEEEDE
jgi:hypothetical protein